MWRRGFEVGCAAALVLGLLCISHDAEAESTPSPDKAKNAKPAPDKTKEPAAENCPPGAFCEQAEVEKAEPEAQPEKPQEPKAPAEATPAKERTVVLPPPPPGSDPNAPRVIVVHPDQDGRRGQVVVYEDGEFPPYWEGDPGPAPALEPPTVRHRKRRRRKRRRFDQNWGLNVRLNALLIPHAHHRHDDVGMGGIGASVRYRPTPHVAIDAGADYIGGIDANGYERHEVPVGLNIMAYPNPHSLAQFYVFGGVNWSLAEVRSETWQSHLAEGTSDSYGYFGGQAGVGVEFRVNPLFGIHIDGLGFARVRTDDDQDGRFAEYVDPKTGKTSNVSAAGMIRVGVNFWW